MYLNILFYKIYNLLKIGLIKILTAFESANAPFDLCFR